MRKASDKRAATTTVRLTPDLKRRLDRAAQAGPYRMSITTIIARGIELALEELCTARAKKSAR